MLVVAMVDLIDLDFPSDIAYFPVQEDLEGASMPVHMSHNDVWGSPKQTDSPFLALQSWDTLPARRA